jgi:hypothetical protein
LTTTRGSKGGSGGGWLPGLFRDPLLIAALAVGAGLRFYALGHGLPFVYNPDEANIMARSVALARDLDPHYYLYPSFFFYLLFAAIGALYTAGRLAGRYPDRAWFESRFFEDPTDFYLAGRAVSVVAGLAAIVLTYRLTERRFGRTGARAAAVFLAAAYVHVRDAHYLKHDVFASLLVAGALLAFSRVIDRGSRGDYFAAGGALGVAFATHYYTVFLAPALALCHVAVRGFRDVKRLASAFALAAGLFFLLSPFVVLNFREALDHMRANREVVVDRSLAAGSLVLPSLGFYLRLLVEQTWGPLLLGLTLAGAVLIARRGRAELSLWGGFTVPYLLFITYTFGAGRYLNPVLPALAGAAGAAISALRRRWGAFPATAVSLVVIAQPLYYAVQVDRLFATKDTRTLARDWILENVPADEPVALQSYSVVLPPSRASLMESLEVNDALSELGRRGKFHHLVRLAESSGKKYRLYFVGRGDEKDRIYHDYEELVAAKLTPLHRRGVRLVVLRRAPVEPPRSVTAFYEEVEREGKLVARFSPFDGGGANGPYLDNEDWAPRAALRCKGPVVEIWRLGTR